MNRLGICGVTVYNRDSRGAGSMLQADQNRRIAACWAHKYAMDKVPVDTCLLIVEVMHFPWGSPPLH